MLAIEISFPPSLGFGRYKSIMPEDSKRHPAKFNTHLVEFLISRYTEPGDLVLDPMAGTGILCVIAALRGRDAICIDIEPRFYAWMEMARENVEKTTTLGRKGKIINILGDARKLPEVLKNVNMDIIITSPPYGETYLGGGDPERRAERLINAGHDPRRFLGGVARNAVLKHYSEIDAVITSPPYESALEGTSRHTRGGIASRDPRLAQTGTYSYIDAIITSPPYEEIMSEKRHHTPSTGRVEKILDEKRLGIYYPSSIDNIGNLKSSDDEYKVLENSREDLDSLYKKLTKNRRTYLSEMLLVYDGMYKILKKDGYAIVVIKPFQRRFKIVDLPYYTWLLMEKVGFRLEKLYKFRLPTQSFWRILMAKKHPELPRIAHEYIIVARK
jgi:DNA modification methylase